MNWRCRVFGHKWEYTCIGTWGNDDLWVCARCEVEGGWDVKGPQIAA